MNNMINKAAPMGFFGNYFLESVKINYTSEEERFKYLECKYGTSYAIKQCGDLRKQIKNKEQEE